MNIVKKEKLLLWEPLTENPFSRLEREMLFVKMVYEVDFILVFKDYETSFEYTFTYKKPEERPYPILTFRSCEEMARPDIESLIGLLENPPTYNPTFYKVENSDFLAWYDNNFSARATLQPNVEHHLFITSDFFIDVLSEIQPVVTIK